MTAARRVRIRLTAERQRGTGFDDAWARALGEVRRQDCTEALEWSRDEWRAAYERRSGPSVRLHPLYCGGVYARGGVIGASVLACLALLALVPASAAPVQPLGKSWQRGAVVPEWPRGFDRAALDRSLVRLRATGSNHVTIYVRWFMDRRSDSSVEPDRQLTASDRSVGRLMRTARSLGLKVTLAPIVRLKNGVWQALIDPRNKSKWFRSYWKMIGHYAELAQKRHASTLTVGSELGSMEPYRPRWLRLIDKARGRFDGRLTYSASGLGRAVRFWRKLDFIGLSAYVSLSSSDPNPTVRELVRAWSERGYVDHLETLHRRYDRPVLFTEVGYGSREGTAIKPWATPSGPINQEPQRRAYEALYRVWSQFDWFKGVHWWLWPVRYDPSDGTHSPRGKAAEQTMRAWNTAR